jgi:hypothetical protein
MVPANKVWLCEWFQWLSIKNDPGSDHSRCLLFVCDVCSKRTTATPLSYQLCISAWRRLFHVQEIILTKTAS